MLTAAIAVAVLISGAGQAPTRAAPSLVLGRVVDATTNRPISGAIVTLFGSAAVPLPSGSGRRASSSPHLMTNGDGQFVARGLRKGTLFVTVTKGGYLNATNAQQRPNGSAQPIQVGQGQRITDVEVRMWKHAVLTGTVVDESGEPVVGARVQSFSREFIGGRSRYVPADADVVLVNTCGFVEQAKKDSIDTLLAAADQDSGRQGGRRGRLPGRAVRRGARRALPEADAVLGFDDYAEIGARLDASWPASARRAAHAPRDRRTLLPHHAGRRGGAAASVARRATATVPARHGAGLGAARVCAGGSTAARSRR